MGRAVIMDPNHDELRILWLAAAAAEEARAAVESRINEPGFSLGRFEDAADAALQNLKDFMLEKHGLAPADLARVSFK